ncbi:tRNA synthetases class I (C) catalytic domain-containing protein, partial [Ochromonadaceae sp. CCMP2298]
MIGSMLCRGGGRVLRPIRLAPTSRSHAVKLRNSLSDSAGLNITHLDAKKELTWYSCGPTVYDSTHLGHARTYVCTDIIRRIITDYFRLRLTYALGITDVDDKIIQRGVANGLVKWADMERMVRGLEDDFFSDMDRLSVRRPDAVLRVTEHIPEIRAYIEKLLELGSAYVTEDGVYFDCSTLAH